MQKKSHKRKFKVGQMVRVMSTPTTDYDGSDVSHMVGKTYKVEKYEFHSKPTLNYRLADWWFSAKELEAVETPEEFFEEKETDGPIAKVLLKVLERLPIDEEGEWNYITYEYSSYYTCDLIRNISTGGSELESELESDVLKFLDTFGFESKINCFGKFSEFEEGFERQSARFNWILFALTIAREEGV